MKFQLTIKQKWFNVNVYNFITKCNNVPHQFKPGEKKKKKTPSGCRQLFETASQFANSPLQESVHKKNIISPTAACSAFQRVVYLNVAAGGLEEKGAHEKERKGGPSGQSTDVRRSDRLVALMVRGGRGGGDVRILEGSKAELKL